MGRVKLAQGLDAVDGAFSTIYGEVQFKWFEVWAYQVDSTVSIGDPVDMSKRLDGNANHPIQLNFHHEIQPLVFHRRT